MVADMFCNEDSIPSLCGDIIFLIAGFDSEKLDVTLVDKIFNHFPAGASSKTLVHYGQEMVKGNVFICRSFVKLTNYN